MEGDEADLVHHNKLHPPQILQEAVQRALVVALQQEVGKGGGGEEPYPPSRLAGFQGDGRCQMGLAGPNRAQKNEVFFLREELKAFHILPR